MPFYQYTGPEYTLIKTKSGRPEKSKVVQWEIIEIEKDLYEAGRLLIAGFVQIAEEDVEEFKDLLANPRPAPTETTSALMAEPVTQEETKAAEPTDEVSTEPVHTEVETASLLNGAQPGAAVEVTTEIEDDGSKDITLELTTDEPKTDGSEGTDLGSEPNAAAPGAEVEKAPEEVNVVTTGDEPPAADVLKDAVVTTASTDEVKTEETKKEAPKKDLPKKK